MRRHRAGAPLPPAGPPMRAPDPHPQQVAYLQHHAGSWLVMWSPWRRVWTAMARFGARPVILDHPNPYELLAQCRAAEMAAVYRQPMRV